MLSLKYKWMPPSMLSLILALSKLRRSSKIFSINLSQRIEMIIARSKNKRMHSWERDRARLSLGCRWIIIKTWKSPICLELATPPAIHISNEGCSILKSLHRSWSFNSSRSTDQMHGLTLDLLKGQWQQGPKSKNLSPINFQSPLLKRKSPHKYLLLIFRKPEISILSCNKTTLRALSQTFLDKTLTLLYLMATHCRSQDSKPLGKIWKWLSSTKDKMSCSRSIFSLSSSFQIKYWSFIRGSAWATPILLKSRNSRGK